MPQGCCRKLGREQTAITAGLSPLQFDVEARFDKEGALTVSSLVQLSFIRFFEYAENCEQQNLIVKPRRLWLVWENQRRSKVLAAHFGCTLHEIVHEGLLRYPLSVFHTFRILWRERPSTIFVQNPSMILAALAVLWGVTTRIQVVVDRHSTFLLNRTYRMSPWLLLFRALNRLTLKYANLTIVTNEFLADLVLRSGGTPVVLPDKLPNVVSEPFARYPVLSSSRNILFVSSFAEDEPLAELIEAVSQVRERLLHVYVTGKLKKAPASIVAAAPKNVTFTDYLSDNDYVRLLRSVDMVVVLTTADHTMLCGCYEAIAAGQPLVTSRKDVLRSYFTDAIFVDNTSTQIAAALDISDDEIAASRLRTEKMKDRISSSWLSQSQKLEAIIDEGEYLHV